MDQFEEMQDHNKKIFMKLALAGCLAGIFAIGAVSYLFINFYNSYDPSLAVKDISLEEAEKIGYWTLPDAGYVFEEAMKVSMYGEDITNIKIQDTKSKNMIRLLEVSGDFKSKYLIKKYGVNPDEKTLEDEFLEKYVISSYRERKIEKVVLGSNEIYYSHFGSDPFNPLEKKVEGSLGNIYCDNGSRIIVILIVNDLGRYDDDRALAFIKTLSCDGSVDDVKNDPNAKPDSEPARDDADDDNDGLSNAIERAIGTNPGSPDTDGDTYGDLKETKSGYNPVISSPGDKMLPVDFAVFKEKIKKADPIGYRNIFGD